MANNYWACSSGWRYKYDMQIPRSVNFCITKRKFPSAVWTAYVCTQSLCCCVLLSCSSRASSLLSMTHNGYFIVCLCACAATHVRRLSCLCIVFVTVCIKFHCFHLQKRFCESLLFILLNSNKVNSESGEKSSLGATDDKWTDKNGQTNKRNRWLFIFVTQFANKSTANWLGSALNLN